MSACLHAAGMEFGQGSQLPFEPVTPVQAGQAHGVLQFGVQSLESVALPQTATSADGGRDQLLFI